jgi:hypothetical protein
MATTSESLLLSSVEASLEAALSLKGWWEAREQADDFSDRFPLRRNVNPAAESYGFFDVAPAGGESRPILGMLQDFRFDTQKAGSPFRLRAEMREFVLRYLMRVSDFRLPSAYSDAGPCNSTAIEEQGFGYSQLFYKLSATGEIGRFPDETKYEVIDLRDLSWKYEWILLKVDLFDFTLHFQPFGFDRPRLLLPLPESTYVLVTRHFITDDDSEIGDTIGRYGFGYAILKNPIPSRYLAWGPGEFDIGFQAFDFRVQRNGDTSVRMPFVVNRPAKILNFTLDPISTLIDLSNLFTSGAAATRFCISHRALETDFLAQHFLQHYTMIAGALSTWSQVADWLDEGALPEWVKRGVLG